MMCQKLDVFAFLCHSGDENVSKNSNRCWCVCVCVWVRCRFIEKFSFFGRCLCASSSFFFGFYNTFNNEKLQHKQLIKIGFA